MARRKICADVSLKQIDDFFSIGKPITDVETILVSPESITSSEFGLTILVSAKQLFKI